MLESEPPVIDFSSYTDDRTRDFTGRAWVFQAIDAWLADPRESHFFLLTGEPGAGKTAVAARLARISSGSAPVPDGLARLRSGFLGAVHFCSARDRRWINPQTFAESLARQLSANYDRYAEALLRNLAPAVTVRQEVRENWGRVVGAEIGTLVVTASPEDLFNRLVREPLETLARGGLSRPAVILVDALDESKSYTGTVTIADLVTDAGDLPSGVRFVVTSRPDTAILRSLRRSDARECTISPHQRPETSGDSLVLRDVQDYIEHVVRDAGPTFQECLAEDLSLSRLVTTIRDKSEGNFLYVRHLLRMLAEPGQPITVESLAGLPAGLDGIYLEFLQRVGGRNIDVWHQEYGRVLGVLAVSQAPLTEDRLAALTSLQPATVRSALTRVRELLEADDGVSASRRAYSLYHSSFGEFLLNRDRAEEYWLDGVPLHRLIADHYWHAHRAEWEGSDDYGLTYLAAHLFEAGDVARLQSLVDEAWIRVRYQRRSYSYDGVLDDIDLAWQAAEAADRARVATGGPAPYLAEEVRWALCVASIGSLVSHVPADALGALVREGLWSPRQALAHLRRLPVGEPRSRVLATLAGYLPAPVGNEAFGEAMSAANQIADPEVRARVLTWLLPRLPRSLREEALGHAVAAVRELQDTRRVAGGYSIFYGSGPGERYVDTGIRTKALAELGEALAGLTQPSVTTEEVVAQIRAACESEEETERALAVSRLAARLELAPSVPSARLSRPTGALLAGLAAQSAIGDESERANFARVFGDAPPTEPKTDHAERLVGTRSIDSPYFQYRMLADLAPELSDSLLAQALEVARRISDPDARTLALRALAPRLPEPLLRDALGAANTFAPLAPHLPEVLLREAFEKARTIRDADQRAQAMAELSGYLPEPQLTEAVTVVGGVIARGIGDDYEAHQVMAELSPHLPAPLAAEAFAAAKDITVNFYGDRRDYPPPFIALALLGLAPTLPESQRDEALIRVLRAVEGGGWFDFAADWGDAQKAVVRAIDLARRLPDSPLGSRVTTALAERAISEARQATYGRGYPGWNTRYRISLLIRLLPHLPEPQLTQAAGAAVRLIVDEFADPLPAAQTATLATYLPEALLLEAEPAITDGLLPSYLRQEALPAAVEVARRRKNRDWLFTATERLTGPPLGEALRAAHDIGGASLQAELMARHAEAFASLDPAARYAAWSQTLRGMAHLDRPTMLSHLQHLGPVVAAIGGQTAVHRVRQAVDDVGRWWP